MSKLLDSATFLVLSKEHEALRNSDAGGAETVLKLSEKVLQATGLWQDGMGVREMVEKAVPLLRDFFGTLRASATMLEGLDLPPESSGK